MADIKSIAFMIDALVSGHGGSRSRPSWKGADFAKSPHTRRCAAFFVIATHEKYAAILADLLQLLLDIFSVTTEKGLQKPLS